MYVSYVQAVCCRAVTRILLLLRLRRAARNHMCGVRSESGDQGAMLQLDQIATFVAVRSVRYMPDLRATQSGPAPRL